MSIIDKIAALRKKIPENGATEDEALSALALAEKLMEKYGITEKDLHKVEFSRDMREGSFEQRQKAVHPSQKYCSVTIGKFCGVKIWTSHITQTKKIIRMFGLNGDVEMAEFLMRLIHDSMDRAWKEYLQNNPKTGKSRHSEYWGFMIAFSERVNEKIRALMEEFEKTTGADLIVSKIALVEDGLAVMLPSLILTKKKSSSVGIDRNAYAQGHIAGDKVNLNRPINERRETVKRLEK